MKKFLLFFSALTFSSAAFAQTISEGFYRVKNNGEGAYIYVTDNTGSIAQITNPDFGAISLAIGMDKAVSDPASVIYVKHISGVEYDFCAQGTGVYDIIGIYPQITQYEGAYRLGAQAQGHQGYLGADNGKLSTVALKDFKLWSFEPITTNGDNYFGISPEIYANGKYYQPFYAEFAFSFASSGMKAYYVSETQEGYAKLEEIKSSVIPGETPVIIECSSNSPSSNRLEIKTGGGSSVSGNILKGVYFCNTTRGNVTRNDKYTMRVLGVTSKGKLGFVTSDATNIPANQLYLPVSSGTPAVLEAVTEYPAPEVVAESVTLDKESLNLLAGETETLVASVNPSNTTDKTITWKSSDSSVAQVYNGTVTAVSKGTAIITATCGEVSAICTVTVTEIDAESVTLDKTSLEMVEGEKTTLTATVSPNNTSNKTVYWTTSDPSVARVYEGEVTAVGAGTATITAKCGEVSATCEVTVKPLIIDAESVTLDKTEIELIVGKQDTLTAVVAPENVTDATVVWSSSDETVATVENGVVTAIAEGTATITAKCGEVSATCEVTVKPLIIDAESVTLDKTEIELIVGKQDTLTAVVAPENVTDATVVWSSSDETVATVENGVVTAIAEGTATITAKCGEVSATCEVTVKPEETSINVVVTDETVSGVYSILGQKLRAGSSVENLPAGIYIVNGKKIVKR